MNILEGAYGKITMELTINDIVEGDYGVYECKARNFFGDGSNFVELASTYLIQWAPLHSASNVWKH